MDSVDSDKALQEKEAELRRMQEMLEQMQRQITIQKQQGQAWLESENTSSSSYWRAISCMCPQQPSTNNIQVAIYTEHLLWKHKLRV